jgi:ribose transport system permease protein
MATGMILAIPFGILCGVVLGFVNGIGVASICASLDDHHAGGQCRGPGADGRHTGGFSPQDSALRRHAASSPPARSSSGFPWR